LELCAAGGLAHAAASLVLALLHIVLHGAARRYSIPTSECQRIDDGMTNPYIFLRAGYCPVRCNMTPTAPECQNCRNGGNGMF